MTNITVLTDANGVQREYNEVKRKANVGEKVKIVSASRGADYPIGATGECTRNDEFRDGSIDTTITELDEDGFIDCDHATYVVLEPTDIAIVDGVRYREEKRKAVVGERILITDKVSYNMRDMAVGKSYVVKDEVFSYEDFANVIDDAGHVASAKHRGYVVLTPVTEPTPQPTVNVTLNLSVAHSSPSEILHAIKASVDAELAKFEGAPNTKETRDQIVKTLTKTPQQLRDEIVEKAKADVAELLDIGGDRGKDLPNTSPLHDTFYRVEFVDNREKRTVVALVQYCYGVSIVAKGIAKCAPGDCFNVHLGKAIALRRALGIEIPVEYLTVPKPTEVRVGDIVKTKTELGGGWVTKLTSRDFYHDNHRIGNKLAFRHTHDAGWLGDNQFDVTDDSREETEVAAVA
ncbi:hypothetical protein [Brevibacillus daliensis]|uniref:hypothetical protein n=1 Tax=Brevibacillus daliensis TaxID=2892995 RepID=UPI001E3B6369|nr:hypothetical protein [Brevibacillus daliensis]